MGEGLGMFNLQFDPPWVSQGDNSNSTDPNSTSTNSTAPRTTRRSAIARGRGLMSYGYGGGSSSDSTLPGDTTYGDKKDDAKLKLEGLFFYSLLGIVAEGVLHLLTIKAIQHATGLGGALPPNIQFPSFEITGFLALWSPICVSATIAFARRAPSIHTHTHL